MYRCWVLFWLLVIAGCGTTRWSDSSRTATEQMLVSDAIDRAVSSFDLRALAGKPIYLDTAYLKNTLDGDYLVSSLRQHALANGCILRTKAEEAEYVVEIRAGAIGTDRHDLLWGIPATTIPSNLVTGGPPAPVPELPLVKKTDQRAVAKVALFAYNRATGRPVWQSGLVPVESSAKAVWVFGAGPFRKGTIHQGMNFAGEKITIPLVHPGDEHDAKEMGAISVAAEAYFAQPNAELARRDLSRAAASQPVSPPGPDAAAVGSPGQASPQPTNTGAGPAAGPAGGPTEGPVPGSPSGPPPGSSPWPAPTRMGAAAPPGSPWPAAPTMR